ncbi:DUF192 domain-containing protein [Novosphingobium sp. Leaf2]|uniref:DUF192 domain-containing protein n=1 Tax=Novosphingobium sp. Leaf2 TaxID=1735670 RepID=UPI0006F600A6|nr:DUF192 domain-containing protein [Novosphingobium sp. Leaf2]KQM18766.1 hypothetical protein ASE49_06340 [Novosphingobium sp. Leaf2]
MRLTRSSFAAAFLLAFAACSQGGTDATAKPSATQPAVHPISGLPIVPLTVKTAKGKHVFRVEVAKTFAQQEKGLMFRTAMGPNEGMIFPEETPRRAAFWMRNTVIPLDIIFIGTDHRILNIAANAVPYDETPLPSAGVASGVLELNGGRAAQLGIEAGDLVTW